MKKLFALLVSALVFASLVSCNSQKIYSDFDYSYSRSGGIAPIYENFLIKGNDALYSFEGQGKNIKKEFKVTDDEIKMIETALTENNFLKIREDLKKIYDHISVSINVKKGKNSGRKTDASLIMEGDQKKWDNINNAFRQLIQSKVSVPETK
ncbi:M24 family metallopeptidase [Chryseobacterium koreense]|uniref:Uncharacterized protein n=1 Tax=Chryseobacterium koreense CCUG 49689 TaxID=1304281 RepID=A0A0J7IVP3_9FLAO|nr:hypothetical protein [Chryseobacterium koreense]KMQ70057.1 hypothetical protein ACM44_14365 [Chryseobacterium koreense CCUG 49689]MBB5332777.1 hypothetical protein [Chryseobacterium koreense]